MSILSVIDSFRRPASPTERVAESRRCEEFLALKPNSKKQIDMNGAENLVASVVNTNPADSAISKWHPKQLFKNI